MRCARTLLVTAAVALGFGLAADSALAVNPVVANCNANNGNSLSRSFSVSQLEHALGSMSAEERQYSSCAQVIQSAILRITHRLHLNGSGGGSGFPAIIVVLIVVVLLAAGGYGLYALRRRP